MPRPPKAPEVLAAEDARRKARGAARKAARKEDDAPTNTPAAAAARPVLPMGKWCRWEDLTPEQQQLVPPAYRGSKWNPQHYKRYAMTAKMSEARRALRRAGAADVDIDSWVMPLEFLLRVTNATPDIRDSLGFFVDKNGAVHCEELTLGLRIEAAKAAAPYLHRRMPIAVNVEGQTPATQAPLMTEEVLAQLSDAELSAFKAAMQKARQINAAAYNAYASSAAAQQAYVDDEEMSVPVTVEPPQLAQALPEDVPPEGKAAKSKPYKRGAQY